MSVFNLKTAALAITAAVGLGGCAYGPYGGVGVGYGNGYYDPYYSGGYYGAGYGYPYGAYGMPGYGWYDGFYYPGSGYYVYDRDRTPYRWTDAQRRYWEWRQRGAPRSTGGTAGILQNWADFQNGPQATTNTVRQQTIERQRILRERPVTQQQVSTVQLERRAARTQVQQERRTTRTQIQQERRGNRGGRNRHTNED